MSSGGFAVPRKKQRCMPYWYSSIAILIVLVSNGVFAPHVAASTVGEEITEEGKRKVTSRFSKRVLVTQASCGVGTYYDSAADECKNCPPGTVNELSGKSTMTLLFTCSLKYGDKRLYLIHLLSTNRTNILH